MMAAIVGGSVVKGGDGADRRIGGIVAPFDYWAIVLPGMVLGVVVGYATQPGIHGRSSGACGRRGSGVDV